MTLSDGISSVTPTAKHRLSVGVTRLGMSVIPRHCLKHLEPDPDARVVIDRGESFSRLLQSTAESSHEAAGGANGQSI